MNVNFAEKSLHTIELPRVLELLSQQAGASLPRNGRWP